LGTGDILLVEDDETIRTMTTMMLEEMGYSVYPAGTPQEAISFCEDTGIALDVILSDVIMPGMSGKEMMERIELIRPGIKVLYMSGYSSDIISQRGVLEADMHFIQKPFDMKALNAKINDVLA
jgi:DNA-binding NtrC family response regulator